MIFNYFSVYAKYPEFFLVLQLDPCLRMDDLK